MYILTACASLMGYWDLAAAVSLTVPDPGGGGVCTPCAEKGTGVLRVHLEN